MRRTDYEDYRDDYEYADNASQIRRIVTAFIVGGIISSLVTLFITPTTGQQIRRSVRKTVGDVQNQAGRAKEAVEQAPYRAKSAVSDVKDTAKRRASKLKQVGEQVLEEQKESLRHGAEEAIDVMKSG